MSKALPKKDLQIKAFTSAAAFRAWLARHAATAPGLWLRVHKKASGRKTVTYAEALDEALCYGWIDGQKAAGDATSFLLRFTPRRARSVWSKRNTAHADRLVKAGRMRAPGRREIEAAKADGRWAKAYDSPATATIPPAFLRALGKNARAKRFFATLNKANLYAIAYRLQTAKKPETKARRSAEIIARLARGEALHVMRS